MKKYFTLINIVLTSFGINAQQHIDFIQIKNDLIISNPAAPPDHYLRYGVVNNVSAVYRSQWLNFEDGPKTYGLQYRNMYEPMNISFGLTILKDDTGAISNQNILGNFGYNLILDKERTKFLSFGISAGISQYTVRLSEINFAQNTNLQTGVLNELNVEIGFGTFFTVVDKLYGGVAVPQLFNSNSYSSAEVAINKIPHIIGQLGGYIELNDFILEPFATISTVADAPPNMMGGILFRHTNGFLFGGGFNTAKRPNATVGYTYKTINDRLITTNISYGSRIGNLRNILGNTVELLVVFSWGKSNIIYCPQF